MTVNGTNGKDVFVNYYRIANDSSTETLESEDMILNSATGNETTASWPVQTNNTAAYRVVVHDNNGSVPASDVGNITVTTINGGGGGGGAGGFLDGGNSTLLAALAAVAGGAVLFGGNS